MDCISSFTDAVHKSLKKGVNQSCKITVNFRTDVFTYLFQNKGSAYDHGRGRLYTAQDFDPMYFPQDWYQVYDQLGDGCEIEFPVRMISNVKWSRTTYTRSDIGVCPRPKHYTEVCTLWIVKRRC